MAAVKIHPRKEALNPLPAEAQLSQGRECSRQGSPPWASVYCQHDGAELCGPYRAVGTTGGAPAGKHRRASPRPAERRGESAPAALGPASAPPRARIGSDGGGASTLAAPGLFPLVVVAARARKRTGAEAEAAEAPRESWGCGAVLDSACPALGPAAMHPPAPGPLGDCLRDWEELQQEFQSIQVSASGGAH